ncbi:hypothetical protein D770_18510 [Flammeovirgaceae bacterium 311]|nr:hypothetical protein D770_18510 [Flammeovirgaceae bacterium 311]
MKKVFMLMMIAGATLTFASCGSSTSDEGTVIATDTTDVQTEYEVERTAVEVDTTTETETVEVESDGSQQ